VRKSCFIKPQSGGIGGGSPLNYPQDLRYTTPEGVGGSNSLLGHLTQLIGLGQVSSAISVGLTE